MISSFSSYVFTNSQNHTFLNTVKLRLPMEFHILFTLLILYLVIYIGNILGKFTAEELHPGKNYLATFEQVLVLLFYFTLIVFYNSWVVFGLLALLTFFLYKPAQKLFVFFGIFALIAYIVRGDYFVFVTILVLFTLLSLIWGSQITSVYVRKEKLKKKLRFVFFQTFLQTYPYLIVVVGIILKQLFSL